MGFKIKDVKLKINILKENIKALKILIFVKSVFWRLNSELRGKNKASQIKESPLL